MLDVILFLGLLFIALCLAVAVALALGGLAMLIRHIARDLRAPLPERPRRRRR